MHAEPIYDVMSEGNYRVQLARNNTADVVYRDRFP
jgi:hypothetical protein